MRKNLLLILLAFSLTFSFPSPGFTQVNEYSLVPVDLQVGPSDSIVEVDVYIELIADFGMIKAFFVPLFAEGTSNPVLDTVLTGGLVDPSPAFNPPSLVNSFTQKAVNPYGPPGDPLYFLAVNFGEPGIPPPANGLFCRMFYHVDGPGTLTFRTAVHSTGGPVLMNDYNGSPVPINWPAAGDVGSFEVTQAINEYSLVPVDLEIGRGDSIVQVNVNIKTAYSNVYALSLPLFAEGTSNPVLDTILTGGLTSVNPPAFDPPSLVSFFTQRQVFPYGPPAEPMFFGAFDGGGGINVPSEGLFCRMFYKVSGPGTLTFRTAVHPTMGQVGMINPSGQLPVNWPAEGEVGSFNVTQVNKYSLVPVNLKVLPGGGIVQVNINIATIDYFNSFVVPLFAEGTCNPVLDTALTGGASDVNPPAFLPPSLVSFLTVKQVYPYGSPAEPMAFVAAFGSIVSPASGLYCRMWYRVDGPGTLTFRTAVHSILGPVRMSSGSGPGPINWPAEGIVGSFEVSEYHGDANDDNRLNVSDVVYLINYIFKGGPDPIPMEAGDVNCDGKVSVGDAVYLINYLFKGGPPPPC